MQWRIWVLLLAAGCSAGGGGAPPPPSSPFASDADTAALYHFDEGTGTVALDSAQAPGGPSDGEVRIGGAPVGPEWSSETPFGP
ncbi:MAG: hypothetical protein ACYTEZ_05655 [Planctomycetota bacterium]|jgi:hypothetical protein